MKYIVSNIKSWFMWLIQSLVKKRTRPNWRGLVSKKGYRKALEIRIISRANKDIKKGDLKKAIDRFEGFFNFNSVNQEIHNRIAKLYIQTGDKRRAGRHLYFKENPSDLERDCIKEFEKSYGYSPTIILKKIIHKEHYRIKNLDNYTKLRLKYLINEATIESEITPNFLKGVKRYLDKNI